MEPTTPTTTEIIEVLKHLQYSEEEIRAWLAKVTSDALRAEADYFDRTSVETWTAFHQHNLWRDPNKPRRREDLMHWANAYEAAGHHLRMKARQISVGE